MDLSINKISRPEQSAGPRVSRHPDSAGGSTRFLRLDRGFHHYVIGNSTFREDGVVDEVVVGLSVSSQQ